MNKDIEIIQKQTYKLLDKYGRRIWENVKWDSQEIGNIKIGFINIDPGISPIKIATFINGKAKELLSKR
ncbi:MAG: hypothetical protein A2959_04070 [Candidatus Levybacteria bacterium RIFCSPLOWO2_01_FULL_38_23]|nr:MAG: hypothetical protein A2959_04070 [Candidatus Levybacteria bacterium RIFCSPLOWO2_01_FULL_38_23]